MGDKSDKLINESNKLSEEAKMLLSKLFKIPEGFSDERIDRLIDCIVGSAMLEVASFIREPIQQENQS